MQEPLTIFWETGQTTGDALLIHADDGRPILIQIPRQEAMAACEAVSDDILQQTGGFIGWMEIGIRNRYSADRIAGTLHDSADGHVLIVRAEDLADLG